jgi:hypothetical protein
VDGVAGRALVLLTLLAARAPAQSAAPARPLDAATPRVRVLATTEGPFRSFDEPSCARAGFAVFHAVGKDGRDSIFASSGGAAMLVARAGGQVADGAQRWTIAKLGTRPTVNDRFLCAFTVEFTAGGRAVLVGQGVSQNFEFAADSGEAFRSFGDDAMIDARRAVLFRALIDPPGHPDTAGFDRAKVTDPRMLTDPDRNIAPPERLTVTGKRRAFHEGLFLERIGARDVVLDTHSDCLDLQDDFASTDGGAIALIASQRPSHWSLLLFDEKRRPIEVAETGVEWRAFHRPALNLLGKLAFVAETIDGGAVVCRAVAGVPRPAILADARTGFVAIGPNVSIDDRGAVAFVGAREDDSGGLYLVDQPGQARLVLPIGTPAGRATISAIRLSNRAFGRPGQLVALVALDPEGEAIVSVELPR